MIALATRNQESSSRAATHYGCMITTSVVGLNDLKKYSEQIALILGITKKTIHRWIRKGTIPAYCRENVMAVTADVATAPLW